ncbi:DUF4248 domain-containing protein [Aquimarina aquimarini]|uniref:DUF4248 domain-containing protein n=1 Tax=Aquimarina aquimarini TaxID=1191734 RepID=UPI000D55B82D|nr:DUF4248 domain-containing protein [Aquimarina aquimarini]
MNQNKKTSQGIYFAGEEPVKIKAYYKYELATMYDVSTKTFSTWINTYIKELQQFGYKKTTKLLRPEVVRFLFERIGEP